MEIKEKIGVKQLLVHDNGIFPNSKYPALLYKNALQLPSIFAGSYVKELFRKNNWMNNWKSGVFTYHHYHSITHEVLGIIKGETTILLGGDDGFKVRVEKGDVLIIPAGVAHKNLGNEDDVTCIGAYPDGRDYDMNYGVEFERPKTDENISKVPLPDKDPVFGAKGLLFNYWK